jgi:hypothetical protein
MGRPVVMRSIKRQRVRAAGDDACDAGHAFASAAGAALRAAPDNPRTPGKRAPVKRKRSRK